MSLKSFSSRFPRSRLFWRLFVAHFLLNISITIYFLLPLRIEDIGGTKTQIGLIMGLALVAGVLIRPFSGAIMDRSGRRIWFLIGGILSAFPCFLYMAVDHIGPLIYMTRILHGTGIGILFGVFFTAASDLSPPDHEVDHIGIFGISGLLPMGLGPKLGEMLLVVTSFQMLFLVSGVLALVSLALTLTVPETAKELDRSSRLSFRIHVTRRLFPVWVNCILFGAAITTSFTFLSPYARASGFHGISTFFAAYVITSTICRLFLGNFPERWGTLKFLHGAFAALTLGFVTISMAKSETGLAFAGVIIGFGHAYLFPILVTLSTQRSSKAQKGGAVSISTAMMDTGGLLSGPLFGIIGDRFGYSALFLSAAGCGLLAIMMTLICERRDSRCSRTEFIADSETIAIESESYKQVS